MGGIKLACQGDPRRGSTICRHGWEGATMGMHEWVQGLMAAFQEAQEQERQARQDHTFQATGDSQQTLMGTHVIKALQVSLPLPFARCPMSAPSCLSCGALWRLLLPFACCPLSSPVAVACWADAPLWRALHEAEVTHNVTKPMCLSRSTISVGAGAGIPAGIYC